MIRLPERPSYRPTRRFCSWTGRFRVYPTAAPADAFSTGAGVATISDGADVGPGDPDDHGLSAVHSIERARASS